MWSVEEKRTSFNAPIVYASWMHSEIMYRYILFALSILLIETADTFYLSMSVHISANGSVRMSEWNIIDFE